MKYTEEMNMRTLSLLDLNSILYRNNREYV